MSATHTRAVAHVVEAIGVQPVVIIDEARAVDYSVRYHGIVHGLVRIDERLFDRVAGALDDAELLADFEAWRLGRR